MQRYSKSKKICWTRAPDVKKRVRELVERDCAPWAKPARIICFRSYQAKTRATARIWGLSRIWQLALGEKPKYIIEVIAERFDKLSWDEQNKVLIHELAHIPGNFSGALIPHRRRGKGNFYSKVGTMINAYEKGRRRK